MILHVIYRRAERVIVGEKLAEPFEDIIIMSTVGASEVYLADISPAAIEHPGKRGAARESEEDEKEGAGQDDAPRSYGGAAV